MSPRAPDISDALFASVMAESKSALHIFISHDRRFTNANEGDHISFSRQILPHRYICTLMFYSASKNTNNAKQLPKLRTSSDDGPFGIKDSSRALISGETPTTGVPVAR